jgi:hypothetical protein
MVRGGRRLFDNQTDFHMRVIRACETNPIEPIQTHPKTALAAQKRGNRVLTRRAPVTKRTHCERRKIAENHLTLRHVDSFGSATY